MHQSILLTHSGKQGYKGRRWVEVAEGIEKIKDNEKI